MSSSWFGFRALGFGTHSVVLRALDRAANRTDRAFTISKVTPASFGDRAAPRVRWRSVPQAAGGSARIAVHLSDRGAGLRKSTLYLDGRRLPPAAPTGSGGPASRSVASRAGVIG